MTHLGAIVRRIRVRRGFTLRVLAQSLGISISRLCDVEHGRRPLGLGRGGVGVGRLDALARALDVPVETLTPTFKEQVFEYIRARAGNGVGVDVVRRRFVDEVSAEARRFEGLRAVLLDLVREKRLVWSRSREGVVVFRVNRMPPDTTRFRAPW